MRKTRQLMPSNKGNSRKRESNVDSFYFLIVECVKGFVYKVRKRVKIILKTW